MIFGVAVSVEDTCAQTPDEVVPFGQFAIVSYLAAELYELRENIAEEFLILFGKALARQRVYPAHQVAGLRDGGLPPEVVTLRGDGRIVVGVGIAHRRDELVLQTEVKRLVDARDGIERGSRMLQFIVCQLKRDDGMMAGRAALEVEGRATAKREHLKEFGAVHLVGINPEGRAGWIVQIPLQIAREEKLRKRERTAES